MGRGPNWQWNRRRESRKVSYNFGCILRMPVTRRFFFNLLLWRTYSNWALWVRTPKKKDSLGRRQGCFGAPNSHRRYHRWFCWWRCLCLVVQYWKYMEIISKWESFRNRKLKKKLGHQPKPLTDYRDCDKSSKSLQDLKLKTPNASEQKQQTTNTASLRSLILDKKVGCNISAYQV